MKNEERERERFEEKKGKKILPRRMQAVIDQNEASTASEGEEGAAPSYSAEIPDWRGQPNALCRRMLIYYPGSQCGVLHTEHVALQQSKSDGVPRKYQTIPIFLRPNRVRCHRPPGGLELRGRLSLIDHGREVLEHCAQRMFRLLDCFNNQLRYLEEKRITTRRRCRHGEGLGRDKYEKGALQ